MFLNPINVRNFLAKGMLNVKIINAYGYKLSDEVPDPKDERSGILETSLTPIDEDNGDFSIPVIIDKSTGRILEGGSGMKAKKNRKRHRPKQDEPEVVTVPPSPSPSSPSLTQTPSAPNLGEVTYKGEEIDKAGLTIDYDEACGIDKADLCRLQHVLRDDDDNTGPEIVSLDKDMPFTKTIGTYDKTFYDVTYEEATDGVSKDVIYVKRSQTHVDTTKEAKSKTDSILATATTFRRCPLTFCSCSTRNCKVFESKTSWYNYEPEWEHFMVENDGHDLPEKEAQKRAKPDWSISLCQCHFENREPSPFPMLCFLDYKNLHKREHTKRVALERKLNSVMTSLRNVFDAEQINDILNGRVDRSLIVYEDDDEPLSQPNQVRNQSEVDMAVDTITTHIETITSDADEFDGRRNKRTNNTRPPTSDGIRREEDLIDYDEDDEEDIVCLSPTKRPRSPVLFHD